MKSIIFKIKFGSKLVPFVLFFGVILLCGCKSGGDKSEEIKEVKGGAACTEFPYVEVPVYISNQVEALCYNVDNFWNPYISRAAKDTALYHIKESKFEEAYARYIILLQILEREKSAFDSHDLQKATGIIAQSHRQIFAVADSLYAIGFKKPLMRLIELSERYLYNPNSPFLNEELYIPVVDAVLDLKSLDSIQKMQHKYQKQMVMLNRKGTKAADFDFEYLIPDKNFSASADMRQSGVVRKYSSLYGTPAQYLLIYFNNPGCASCKEIQAVLTGSPVVGRLLEEGKLKVLSMFIDKDTGAWEERFADSPQNWIYARDYRNQFEANELYGIRAIPSIYLLDADKRVILKDAPVERIIEYFNRKM